MSTFQLCYKVCFFTFACFSCNSQCSKVPSYWNGIKPSEIPWFLSFEMRNNKRLLFECSMHRLIQYFQLMAWSINLCIGLNESNFITNLGQRFNKVPSYVNEVKSHVPMSRVWCQVKWKHWSSLFGSPLKSWKSNWNHT